MVTVAFLIVAGAALPASPPEQPAAAASTRPNVLLVTLDTVRADHFSMYGHKRNGFETTPHFDALARDGVRFDMAMSVSSATPISHASLLTGLYPPRHGVRVIYAAAGYKLDAKIPTATTLLRAAGYRTGAFLSAFPVSEFYGFEHGFDTFDSGVQVKEASPFKASASRGHNWNVKRDQRRSDATTDRFLEWLPKTQEPFFGWIHYWDPHDIQLRPPPEWSKRFVPSRRPATGDEKDDFKRAVYDAELAYVDHQFGRVVEALKASGQLERTVIVVISDHGEGLGDHDWWNHRILYQEQIHVPLIVRLPGGPKGRVVADLVRCTDVLPTIMEAAGVKVPEGIDGRSLTPLIRGEKDEARTAYAEAILLYDQNAASTVRRSRSDALMYVAMDRAWKLIHKPEFPEKSELYHLAADPKEATNVYRADHPEALRLKAMITEDCLVRGPFGTGEDASAMKTLAGLGYLGHDDEEDDEHGEEDADMGGDSTGDDERRPTETPQP